MHLTEIKYVVIMTVLVLGSCNSQDVSTKNKDNTSGTKHSEAKGNFPKDSSTSHLLKFIIEYKAKGIELCDGYTDTLSNYDLNFIFSVNNDTIKRKIIYPLLLKHYKYQLLDAHQGYDLLAMRNEPCSTFINEFIHLDSLEFEYEFLNSGYLYYNILKRKKMIFILKDTLIHRLVNELDIITKDLDNRFNKLKKRG